MIIVVLGVAGSGKTTVGSLLAEALGCAYLDGDSLHPVANLERMQHGVALTDGNRAPWLAAIRERLLAAFDVGRSLVIGCSALKESYRRALEDGLSITWVYLKGSEALIRSRLQRRTDHFMGADMLSSQLDELEEPLGAITADIGLTPDAIVRQVVERLRAARDVRVFADADAVSHQLAEVIAARVRRTVNSTGRCSLALSGGSSPRRIHELLATRLRDRVPWTRVHLFWVDERYVAHDHPDSNFRMARETLLDHVSCPPGNVHPMPTHHDDPDSAAADYEATLRRHFGNGWPRFDLTLLGMGPDGHTASLFPGAAALDERRRAVIAVAASAVPPVRLTLTLPVLNRSLQSHILALGGRKAIALGRVLGGVAHATIHPVAAIQPASGSLVWWADRAAAQRLGTPDSWEPE